MTSPHKYKKTETGMKNMSETNQTKLTNLLTRKDFLGELRVNEDLMKLYLEDDKEIPAVPDAKSNYLDRDEVILSFDDFVKRKKH